MKVAVVINQGAGSVEGQQIDEARVERAFSAARVAAAVTLVDRDQLPATLAAALESGVDAVVVGGGDGTISTAAGLLAGKDIPLGVLPLGTANHFAKDLGIPLELDEAARVIAEGYVKSISVAEVNDRVFINNSLLGFYPHVVKARKALRKRFPVNKVLARWISAVKVFPTFPLINVEMEVEGRTVACRTPFIFIGAHEYEMEAFSFGAARSGQGNLFIYMVRDPGRMRLIQLFLTSLVRDVRQEKYFDTFSAPQVTIHTERQRASVFADGELFALDSPLVYRSLPGALRVIVPKPE